MAFLNIKITKEVVKIESYEGKSQSNAKVTGKNLQEKLQEKTKKNVFLSRNSLFSSSNRISSINST